MSAVVLLPSDIYERRPCLTLEYVGIESLLLPLPNCLVIAARHFRLYLLEGLRLI